MSQMLLVKCAQTSAITGNAVCLAEQVSQKVFRNRANWGAINLYVGFVSLHIGVTWYLQGFLSDENSHRMTTCSTYSKFRLFQAAAESSLLRQFHMCSYPFENKLGHIHNCCSPWRVTGGCSFICNHMLQHCWLKDTDNLSPSSNWTRRHFTSRGLLWSSWVLWNSLT